MNAPIIITEIPRSGADMVATALSACGVWIGDGVERDGDRSRFWNKEIQTQLVRPMLRGMNADVVGIQRFPDLKQCQDVAPFASATWRKRIEEIIRSQGYSDGPWAYMASDAAMLWPVWVKAFPDAQWVIVRRNTEKIIASCLKDAFHGTPHDQTTLEAWIRRFEGRFSKIREQEKVREIWPADFIHGLFSSLKALVTGLGLEWNESDVQSALTPVLWGNGVFEVKGVR